MAAERLLHGVQHGRPGAVEQVLHLLELAADLGEQLLPAGAVVRSFIRVPAPDT